MTATALNVPFVDLHWQHETLLPEIKQAMEAVVERGDFILGGALKEFEEAFAQACEAKYGVGVASGTDAISLGLTACGIGVGDEVIVPANTFIATVIGVIGAGATPILVDCDPQTALIDLESAAAALTPRTKAIIPVHLYGQMVSPGQINNFAASHGLIVFEDAAQAHLATREGYKAGSLGKAAAFSFYPSKNLGAFGNGGMMVTSDEEVAQKVRSLRNYGAPKKYYHTDLGTNSRLDTMQAAILQVKLPHLKEWNNWRNIAAQYYDQLLHSLISHGIVSMKNYSGEGHVYHLYVIRIKKECPVKRDLMQDKLAARGIQTGIHYPIPCHLQPAYSYLGYKQGDFPHAEILSQQILSLPMYPGLRREQIEEVAAQLNFLCNQSN